MDALERYLRELTDVRPAGVKETSFYPVLATLLNDVGKTLKPRVRCIIHPSSKGAGLPDGGLFTADQLRKDADALTTMKQLLPARGVIEAKGTGDDALTIARSPQVAKYLDRYGQVLVTTLRDFVLVERGTHGPILSERYVLAETEAAFWQAAARPHETAAVHGDRFMDFLARVMLHAAPLTTTRDLAWFLASYARDARAQLAGKDLPALASIRAALEDGLGLRFEGARGDAFFLSTFLQTLFYGIFSAWVLWHMEQPDRTELFNWRLSEWYLRVPVIAALFESLSTRSRLQPLGLVEVLDRAAATLNRVDRPAFFAHFAEEHAVQYFYEPFLEAFDPDLRRELGVWYTPPEIVRYMVARVDTVLKEELGIADGLADERVCVLDPCCGTGTYLLEVVRHIHAAHEARGGDALGGSDLKQAVLHHVFGFEVLPAPFVVAHLQLGLLLQRLGAPLTDGTGERAGVYLTNALTGWQASDSTPSLPGFPELAEERDAAEAVKRQRRILVVLGNPPYNGYAGLGMEAERDVAGAYRVAKRTKQPQGQGLNDLYVRFFRVAERRIVEETGAGVVAYISNSSWLDGLSHTAMRERYLEVFDHLWIDNLNGDKYRTGKVTPEGLPDPSVFSTEYNREGIQVGTAIATLVRRETRQDAPQVAYREFWGQGKRAALIASLNGNGPAYHNLAPPVSLGFPLAPMLTQAAYEKWPLLTNLFPKSFPGVKTSRDSMVVDINRDRLEARMRAYFDPAVSDEAMRQIAPGVMEDGGRFDAVATRRQLQQRGLLPANIMRYVYRPFDVRWLYWEPETKLLDEKRADYFPHVSPGNFWLVAVQQNRKDFDPPLMIEQLGSLHMIERGANVFPLYLRPVARTLFDVDGASEPLPNLSERARQYLAAMDAPPDALFFHALAVLHAPAYREENAGALRQDWPRVPLPADRAALDASAALGRQIAALLDTEQPVPGVTTGAIRPELRTIGVVQRVGGGNLTPEAGDLAMTAGWGHGGKGGVTMPGRGRATARDYTATERASIGDGIALLGETTRDVFLNDVAYWENVPARVWEYTIGGYQVMKKWLSYREAALLGRPLTVDEAREVTGMARRIAALLLLTIGLDTNYAEMTATQ